MAKDQDADGVYDYVYPPGAKSVVLIVRPRNTYGKAPAGAKVRIAEDSLEDKSVLAACMTLQEHSDLEAQREKRRQARTKTPSSGIKAVVEGALARIGKNATEK